MGYHTSSIGKVFHPGISSNFTDDYPLSWSNVTFHPKTEKFMNSPVCVDRKTGKWVKNLVCPVSVEFQPDGTLPDIESTEETKRQIEEFQKNPLIPFFLAVGFHKPHIPLKFPYEYLKDHPIEKFELPYFNNIPYDLPSVAWAPYNDIRKRYDVTNLNLSYPYGPMDKHLGMEIRQGYYASVTYVDKLIGEILDSVDLTKTIVVLTSDHGWSLGEHAEWSKFSNYDVALRVPLIIHDPQNIPTDGDGHKIDTIIELIDIFPTLVDLAGYQLIPKCDDEMNKLTCTEGKSLASLMLLNKDNEKRSSDETHAYSQYPRPGDIPQVHPNSDQPKLYQISVMGYTIRTPQFRYTLWIGFNSTTFTKSNKTNSK